jgi:Na+-driven multidrug efflux pump
MAFLASLARTVVFFIPLILILPNFWYLDGVWAAYPLSDFLALVTVIGLLIPLLREFKKAGNEVTALQKS